jgi:hypothetical protein
MYLSFSCKFPHGVADYVLQRALEQLAELRIGKHDRTVKCDCKGRLLHCLDNLSVTGIRPSKRENLIPVASAHDNGIHFPLPDGSQCFFGLRKTGFKFVNPMPKLCFDRFASIVFLNH